MKTFVKVLGALVVALILVSAATAAALYYGALQIDPGATIVIDDQCSGTRYFWNEATPQDDVIAYCRIGERSSHTWFLLTKILGYDVKNYDGSWTEYGNTVGVPVVNTAGTVWGVK